jgi:hypothetical protein
VPCTGSRIRPALPDDREVQLEACDTASGVPHAFVADLGEVDNVLRTVFIDGHDAVRYAQLIDRALSDTLPSAEGHSDLMRLQAILLGATGGLASEQRERAED